MILYSFICQDGHTFDDFCEVQKRPNLCPKCGSKYLERNYMAETKRVRPDWEPGFNRSMGIHYKGRRDLFEKARGAGFGLYGHGGSIFNNKSKRFYGDEEYRNKVQHADQVDRPYLEMLQKGITTTEENTNG